MKGKYFYLTLLLMLASLFLVQCGSDSNTNDDGAPPEEEVVFDVTLTQQDTDGDKVSDYDESRVGSDPNKSNTDGDDLPDLKEFEDYTDQTTFRHPAIYNGFYAEVFDISRLPSKDLASIKAYVDNTANTSLASAEVPVTAVKFDMPTNGSVSGAIDRLSSNLQNNFAIKYTANYFVPVKSNLTFAVDNVDDGVGVYLDGNLVATAEGQTLPIPDPGRDTRTIQNVDAGVHLLEIYYWEETLEFSLSFTIDTQEPQAKYLQVPMEFY
jgi:hypothetical protein